MKKVREIRRYILVAIITFCLGIASIISNFIPKINNGQIKLFTEKQVSDTIAQRLDSARIQHARDTTAHQIQVKTEEAKKITLKTQKKEEDIAEKFKNKGINVSNSEIILYILTILASLLGGNFLPDIIMKKLSAHEKWRQWLLGDLNVEGYWYVIWLGLPSGNGEQKEVGEQNHNAYKGCELTQFSFTEDFEYLLEHSITFPKSIEIEQPIDIINAQKISSDKSIPEDCSGRCQLTNSSYQIHVTDERKYISSFEYNDGVFRKSGITKAEFLTPPGAKKPLHYEGIVIGIDDTYREKHIGVRVSEEVIEYFKSKKYEAEDCEWQRQVLINRGKIPKEQSTGSENT